MTPRAPAAISLLVVRLAAPYCSPAPADAMNAEVVPMDVPMASDRRSAADPTAPTEGAMKISEEVKACIDRWIRKHGLNDVGDPPDTAYTSTPLFDEHSGKRMDRYEYILLRHPELKDCKGDGP